MADLDPKALEAACDDVKEVYGGTYTKLVSRAITAYLSALVPTPPPVEAAQEPVAWRNVADAPTVSKGNERLFVVAVRRARTGKVHTFPANYLNAYPLHFDEPCKECPGEGKGCGMEDGDGCPRTGWYTCSEGGEYDYTYSRLLLDPGDEHVGWCEFPSYAAPATGWRPTHRHVKTGGEYMLLGIGRMQTLQWNDGTSSVNDYDSGPMPVDMREVAIYRGKDGILGTDGLLWVRPVEEFNDGRFAPLHAEGE